MYSYLPNRIQFLDKNANKLLSVVLIYLLKDVVEGFETQGGVLRGLKVAGLISVASQGAKGAEGRTSRLLHKTPTPFPLLNPGSVILHTALHKGATLYMAQ